MLTTIAVLVAGPFALLTLAFGVEVFVGLGRGRRGRPPMIGDSPRTIVLIPAHDEAAIIGRTLAALRAELDPGMRILVVADNCTDATARIAREDGIDVIERWDPARRGKGFALACARDHLAALPAVAPPEAEPPEAVVVLDADCSIDRASLRMLAGLAAARGRPAQSVNLLRPDLDAAPMVQVSNFAFALKNLVRQVGLERLSGRINLTGTGMAFPWRLFASAPLATDDIVEDLGLGLDMARAGAPPMLAAEAFVWSGSSTAEGTLTQRTRWEGGFLSTSMRRAPGLMLDAARCADPRRFWAGLSLVIPPLALLGLANAAAVLVGAGLVALGASPAPLIAQIAIGTFAAASVLAAWIRMGRPFLSPAAAARLPFYMLWKIPLYFGLLKRKPDTWLRTGR